MLVSSAFKKILLGVNVLKGASGNLCIQCLVVTKLKLKMKTTYVRGYTNVIMDDVSRVNEVE